MGRILGFVGLMMAMGIGLYIYSEQVKTVAGVAGTASPAEAANMAGIKNDRGGAIVMRPLLLHASSSCSRPEPRRVVHLEFAADDLPEGLE